MIIKKILRSLTIFFLLLFNTNLANANTDVVFLDVDFLMKNATAAKSMTSQLSKIHNKNIKKFESQELELKKEQTNIVKQKNLLKQDEYNKKILKLEEKIKIYNLERDKAVSELSQKKNKAEATLTSHLKIVLKEYSKKNSISLVINKNNVLLGKNELNITNDILEIFNKKFKKIQL